MKYRFFHHTAMLTLVAGAMLLSSCDHKDLCYRHPHGSDLHLTFDWSQAPDADPKGMCVYFYDADGASEPLRYDFQGRDGGSFTIPQGRYRVIAFNNDTEAAMMRGGHSYDALELYTREGGLLEPVLGSGYNDYNSFVPRTGEERVVISPDMVWGTSVEQLDVTADTREIVLTPATLVCRYTYEVRNVDNLHLVQQACGSLTGMGPSIVMSSAFVADERVTIPFEAHSDGVSTISGEFLTFGYDLSCPRSNRLVLYLWLQDGRKLCFGTDSERFEVSDQILNAPDPRNVHIIIDGLKLGESSGTENDFNPSVDGWADIDLDIQM